jgi:hypothetical protein
MRKIFSLGLVIVSSFLLSACGLNQNNSTNTSKSSESNQPSQEFSLKDLLTKGSSQKCIWTSEDDDNISTGELLIKGDKFKQVVTIKNGEETMKVNAISDGQYVYTWGDQASSGTFAMKMKLDNTEVNDDTSNDSASSQVDLNQKQKFNCSPANVSDADLSIPKDIEFTDYSQFLDQMKSSVPSISIPDSE